jgi:hypothetical protein
MTCARCRGLMVPADLTDARRSVDCASGWRCLQCGEVTDPVIAANQKGRRQPDSHATS